MGQTKSLREHCEFCSDRQMFANIISCVMFCFCLYRQTAENRPPNSKFESPTQLQNTKSLQYCTSDGGKMTLLISGVAVQRQPRSESPATTSSHECR